jgi:hypothetical protein
MNPMLLLCLLAAIVLASSNPIALEDFPAEYVVAEIEELPEIRISKRSLQRELASPLTGTERISKRSLKTDMGTPLTGMERITRSLKTDDGFPMTGVEKISKRSAEDQEDPKRERRHVFLPSFAKHRQARSIKYETDILDANDVFKREKRQLFLPSFAKRRQGRSIPMEAEDESSGRQKRSIFLPGFARRHGRSLQDEDMDTAETAVFLPAFARRG